MKTKIRGLIALALVLCMVVGLFGGCGAYEPDLSENVTVNMAVLYNKVRMVYTSNESKYLPYSAANGKTYNMGDFKPVWEELQKRLNFTINDVTTESAASTNDCIKEYALSNFEGVDMINGGVALINENGQKGSFINLLDYMDKLPNLKAFLKANSVVAEQMLAGDGKMYFAPYFDGYDDVEKMFIMRTDWVQKLLDGDGQSYDTDEELSGVYYKNYMPDSTAGIAVTALTADGQKTQTITKKYDKNVVLVQNELAVKNGKNLTEALKAYIDSTYKGVYDKRSDLFISNDAAYDADELVALLRCVITNDAFLTGDASKEVVGFWPREYTTNRTQELTRLVQIWGVRGYESRSNFFYFDENGELCDSRMDPEMMDGIERINQLYKEGLVLQDFDKAESSGGTGNHRDALSKANLGFMTYDYSQTTTAVNDLAECKAIDGFCLTGVMYPVANWNNDGKYFQFTESWRSLKTEGWGITSQALRDEKVLDRCLAIMDYMFSEEGNKLFSYGPDEWLDGTIVYNGQEVPRLNDKALSELKNIMSSNYTNYYRFLLGGTLPVGYIKQQGMEYQCNTVNGQKGLDVIGAGIAQGVIHHFEISAANVGAQSRLMAPTVYATTAADNELIKSECSNLTAMFNPGSKASNVLIYIDYIKYGFGGTNASGEVLKSKDGFIQMVKDAGGETFLQIYREAYTRMKANASVIEKAVK